MASARCHQSKGLHFSLLSRLDVAIRFPDGPAYWAIVGTSPIVVIDSDGY